MSKIISAIPDLLTDRKMNISEFKRQTGLNYKTAHGLATGRTSRFGIDTLDAVCSALGIEPSELFKRPSRPRPKRRKRQETQS